MRMAVAQLTGFKIVRIVPPMGRRAVATHRKIPAPQFRAAAGKYSRRVIDIAANSGIWNAVNNGNKLTPDEEDVLFDLNTSMVKAGCCIYDWNDLAELYLNAYCTMKGVGTVLKN